MSRYDQWSVTFRHGTSIYTESVADVPALDLLTADPIRHNTSHAKRTSHAGLRYLNATARHHAHESLFERRLLAVFDFAGAADVASQPFTLTWHDGKRMREHTPDFAVQLGDAFAIVNARPEDHLEPKLIENASAVNEWCFRRGWSDALVVGYANPAITAIEAIESHALAHDPLGYADEILDLLDYRGPTPFAEVCSHFDGYVVARSVLQRLIWDRRVTIDLAGGLEDWTPVALPGAAS